MGYALVYDPSIYPGCTYDSASSTNTAGTVPVITNRGTTFGIEIPAMNHNDELVFHYTCGINVRNIAHSGTPCSKKPAILSPLRATSIR